MWSETLSVPVNSPSTAGLESSVTKKFHNEEVKNDDIPSFQFSWSSYPTEDKEQSPEANVNQPSIEADINQLSIEADIGATSSTLENDWNFETFEDQKDLAEPTIPNIAPPPETKWSENGIEPAEDEWGEMIFSPAVENGDDVGLSRHFKEDSYG